jgi:LSD1 subclass zinc finger protein
MERNDDIVDQKPASVSSKVRQTSFTRSFFQSGSQTPIFDVEHETDESSSDVQLWRTTPPSTARRRRSPSSAATFVQKNRHHPDRQQHQQLLLSHELLMVASRTSRGTGEDYDDDEPRPPPPTTMERQQRHPSWLLDAMHQGQGMSETNLREFLGVLPTSSGSSSDDNGDHHHHYPNNQATASLRVATTTTPATTTENDDEDVWVEDDTTHDVVEQHRILARLQARQLFHELSGQDVDDYVNQREAARRRTTRHEERRAILPPDLHVPGDTAREHQFLRQEPTKTTIRFPPVPPLTHSFMPTAANKSSESMPPEIQTGAILFRETVKLIRDGGAERNGHDNIEPCQIVRCLGCRTHLQVDPAATLVACPSCANVSPNTSTRR